MAYERMSIEEAQMSAINVVVFLKGGGQRNIGLPADFITRVMVNIRDFGFETLHLETDEIITITGFLSAGFDFYQESRVIVVKAPEEDGIQ